MKLFLLVYQLNPRLRDTFFSPILKLIQLAQYIAMACAFNGLKEITVGELVLIYCKAFFKELTFFWL